MNFPHCPRGEVLSWQMKMVLWVPCNIRNFCKHIQKGDQKLCIFIRSQVKKKQSGDPLSSTNQTCTEVHTSSPTTEEADTRGL